MGLLHCGDRITTPLVALNRMLNALKCLNVIAWGGRRFLAEEREISFIYFVEISSRMISFQSLIIISYQD